MKYILNKYVDPEKQKKSYFDFNNHVRMKMALEFAKDILWKFQAEIKREGNFAEIELYVFNKKEMEEFIKQIKEGKKNEK